MSCKWVTVFFALAFFAASGAGAAETVLQGTVRDSDQQVRLPRPKIPLLEKQSRPGADAQPSRLKAMIDIGDYDFAHAMVRQSKDECPERGVEDRHTSRKLDNKVDDSELVIAWEQWHKRVCSAIYENWLCNSRIHGTARTTIHVTRDRHITVEVHDVEISPLALDNAAAWQTFKAGRLESEFIREVKRSVEALDGDFVLEFPEHSRREETSFDPYFRTHGSDEHSGSGYDWRKDDYERVPVN